MLNNFESEKFESKQEKERDPKLMFVLMWTALLLIPTPKTQ